MDLGTFYVALTVEDIKVSKAFYEGLGFKKLEKNGGSVEEKWMVMENGSNKIGLFQGMFPQNTLTYNPTDARSIYQKLKAGGYELTHVSKNIDADSGPCYFAMTDPDGNPILIDQHND
ncbi:MAG: VOC family protein [Bacteroidetes bacterium]|nr:VOC family protein [Bacteroidota bacterium]